MQIPFMMSQQDYIRAVQLDALPQRRTLLLIAIGVLPLLAVAFFASPLLSSVIIYGLIGGLMGGLIAHFLLLPRYAKREYLRQSLAHTAPELNLNGTGIELLGAECSRVITWQEIRYWRHNRSVLLIYLYSNELYCLAKTPAIEHQTLVSYLHKQVGPSV